MTATILLLLLAASPEKEASTKRYWIGLDDIVHSFNKAVNSKPSAAAQEVKKAVAKIRSMPTKNVDSLVLMYSERRIKLAMDYAEFLEQTKFGSEEIFFNAEYSIKKNRENLGNIQKRFQVLAERHRDMDAEQEVVVSYLKEKYGLDLK